MSENMIKRHNISRQILFWGCDFITFGEMAGQIPLCLSVPALEPEPGPEPDPLPALSAGFATSATEGQGSLAAIFTATEQAGTTYHWDFGDGVTDDESGYSAEHLFSETGSYTVTLTVTRSEETAEATQVVSVWPVPDYGKVIVTSSDGIDSGLVNTITSIYADAEAVYRQESLYASIIYAKEHGYGVICRPTTGLTDSRILNEGALAAAWGIVIIHGHGSNSNIRLATPTYIGDIWAVRDADGSYGPGVEFTIPDVTTESAATGVMAGWVAKLMATYEPEIDALRTLFRNLASNGGTFQESNGYGVVDFAAVEAALE